MSQSKPKSWHTSFCPFSAAFCIFYICFVPKRQLTKVLVETFFQQTQQICTKEVVGFV